MAHGSAGQQDGGLIVRVRLGIVVHDVVEHALRLCVVLFVEVGLAHDEVGIIDGLHVLLATDQHRMFVDGFRGLLNGPVQIGQCRTEVRLAGIVIDRQARRVVVLAHLGKFRLGVFHGLLAIPKHIVLVGYIMVGPVGERVFGCGTGRQPDQQGCQQAYQHERKKVIFLFQSCRI